MIPHYLDYHPIIAWMKDGAYQTWCWQNGKVQKYYLEIWAFKFSTPTFLVEWGIFNLAIEGPLYSEKKTDQRSKSYIIKAVHVLLAPWRLPPSKQIVSSQNCQYSCKRRAWPQGNRAVGALRSSDEMERWLTSNPRSSLFLSEGTRKNRPLQTLLIPGDGGNDSYSLPPPSDIESPKFKSWGGKIKFITPHQNNSILKQLQLFGSGRLKGLWPSPEFSRIFFVSQTQDIFSIKEMCVFMEKNVVHIATIDTATQKEMLSSFILTAVLTQACSSAL